MSAGPAPPRSPRSTVGPGADLPVARIVAVLLVLVGLGVLVVVANLLRAPTPTADEASGATSFDPRGLFSDSTPHFLPTPAAALPPEVDAGPPAPAAGETAATPAPVERVKVANTGGVGAILRADPPKGRAITGLRDGTLLDVLEHRQVDDAEWLRVRAPDGTEGWIFGRLVAPAT